MKYILAIGINDYRFFSGGTNKAVLAHQRMFNEYGYGYIYICPINGLRGKYWEVIINCHYHSIKSSRQLVSFLYRFAQKGNSICEIHIHHLLKASIQEVDEILGNIKADIKFYLHDFYTICPSVKMLKNDIDFCGCERMEFSKCKECKYFGDGYTKNGQLRSLLNKYETQIVFIAPSDIVKELWIQAYEEYANSVLVVYHQKLEGKYDGNRKMVGETIKVGYLGETTYAKGWNAWQTIIDNVDCKKYKFFYFGKSNIIDSRISKVKVDFRKNINAMIHSLRENQIDCVLLWPILPETYSYTYYESLASNSFVITNKKSGNIARQVEARGNGIVLNDEKELICLFQNYEILKRYINNFKDSNILGPQKLIENPSILKLVGEKKGEIVNQICNSKVSYEELLLLIYYGFMQGVYYITRKIL